MGTESRPDPAGLIAALERSGPEYNVFQALYLAEIASRFWHPQRNDYMLEQTGMRFRPYEMYVYPPKDIRAIERRNNELTFVLNFMGLYGVNSPLPRCYHEQVAIQQSDHGAGEVPLQNFFDLFNNRFYWLYYQAWKKYRYYLQLRDEPENKIAPRVFSFIGRVSPGQDRAQEARISRFRLLQFSGILSNRSRNKAGLHILLHEFFPKFQITIREFIPHWVKLSEVPVMGGKDPEKALKLGVNAIAGNAMLDYGSRIRVEIGPIDFADYLEFTPQAPQATLLCELLNLYLNDGLEYDVRFIIKSETIVSVAWNDRRLRLGSTIWLGKPRQATVNVDYSYEQFAKRAF